MKRNLLLLALLSATAIAFGQENGFNFKWDNGFKLESADKQFKLKFGGRIMWDNAFFFQDDTLESIYGELHNGTEFRRVRFYNSGTIYGNVGYKLQLDFAGGRVTFKDVFITIKDIPFIHQLTFGHFKEPFHFEALTSSKYITFMERALPVDMGPERNVGLMANGECFSDRFGWQVGVFRHADGAGNDVMANDGFALTGRLTGLPYVNEDRTKLIHIGGSFSYRKRNDGMYSLEARPESHLGLKYVKTGDIEIANTLLVNGEAAVVLGPFSIQGEYTQSNVRSNGMLVTDQTFKSFYTEASYFLTGEHRPYEGSYEGFGRIKPKHNLGDDGCGAWQIALRYSSMNLNGGDPLQGGVEGGVLSDITAGVNWYLNPVTRIMFNYVMANVKDTGKANIAQLRFQVDF